MTTTPLVYAVPLRSLPIGTRFTIVHPSVSNYSSVMERVEDTPAGTPRAKYIGGKQYAGETVCMSKHLKVYTLN